MALAFGTAVMLDPWFFRNARKFLARHRLGSALVTIALVNCSPNEQDVQTSVAEGGSRSVKKAQGGTSVGAASSPKLLVKGGSSSLATDVTDATGGTTTSEPVGITLDPPLFNDVANGGSIVVPASGGNSGGAAEPSSADAGRPSTSAGSTSANNAGGLIVTAPTGGALATSTSATAGKSAVEVDGVAGARTSGNEPSGIETCAGSTDTVTAVIACFCGIKDVADCASNCSLVRQAEADYYITCRAAYRALMLCQAALPANLRTCQTGTVVTPTRCTNENAAYWACAKVPPK